MTKNLDFQDKTGACVFCASENKNPLDNKEIKCVYIWLIPFIVDAAVGDIYIVMIILF